MSGMTRDRTAEPIPKAGTGSDFPQRRADHKHDWQTCPVDVQATSMHQRVDELRDPLHTQRATNGRRSLLTTVYSAYVYLLSP